MDRLGCLQRRLGRVDLAEIETAARRSVDQRQTGGKHRENTLSETHLDELVDERNNSS